MRLSLLFAALALAACATGPKISEIQAACDARYPAFRDSVKCLRTQVMSDSRAKPPQVLEYMATADHLADEVAAGRITDSRARLELARLYSRIVSERDAKRQAVIERRDRRAQETPSVVAPPPWTPPPTTTTECSRRGDRVVCRSETQ